MQYLYQVKYSRQNKLKVNNITSIVDHIKDSLNACKDCVLTNRDSKSMRTILVVNTELD
jgi:hypothetical protein